jgi:uncharacterized protein
MSLLANWAVSLIQKYQRQGGEGNLNVECNFIPSCSEYGLLCIRRFGFFRGTWLLARRLARCNHRDLVGKIFDAPPV